VGSLIDDRPTPRPRLAPLPQPAANGSCGIVSVRQITEAVAKIASNYRIPHI